MSDETLSQQSIKVAKEILDQIIEVTQNFHDDETIDGVTYGNWDLQLNEEIQARKKLETDPVLFFLEEEWTVSKIISDAEATKDLLEDVDEQHFRRTDTSGVYCEWDSYSAGRLDSTEKRLEDINNLLKELKVS